MLNVVPDTATKRREFEQQVVKTLFLSNADLKETIDLLRVVLGARRVAPLPGTNALTINDTPDRVAAAERIVAIVDKRRAEIVVDVQILEVSRNKLKEYGIYLTSGLDASGHRGDRLRDLPRPHATNPSDGPYDRDNLVVTSLPGAVVRLLETDTSTRLLANPQLRVSEGETAQARFGDQVPVPVTTFTAIASGGIAQQPITSFEYKNVGVNIDITPRAHHDDEVSLLLKLEISAVGAAGYQGLPTFNSRTVNSTIRLRDGETNMLAGLILDNERRGLTGLPGVASIPFIGRLFAKNKDEAQQTDIVMTLTPHVIRQDGDRRRGPPLLPGGRRDLPVRLRHAGPGHARDAARPRPRAARASSRSARPRPPRLRTRTRRPSRGSRRRRSAGCSSARSPLAPESPTDRHASARSCAAGFGHPPSRGFSRSLRRSRAPPASTRDRGPRRSRPGYGARPMRPPAAAPELRSHRARPR